MFINYSNHPKCKWGEKQRAEASKYGEIIDIPFYQVPPTYDEQQVKQLATQEFEKIMAYDPDAVMCQGEFTLVYRLVNLLKNQGITVLSACSERIAEEQIGENTVDKVSVFKFERFREY